MHNPLCEIFRLLACRTWTDLKDAFHSHLSIGEEGITDYLLLSLKRACPRQVAFKKFSRAQEGGTTGADWEWWFVGRGKGFGMRVQAKKLNSSTLRYEGLDYTVRRSRKKQINLLISDASRQRPPLYPLYCFYNYLPNPHTFPHWNCAGFPPQSEILGCTVSDARLIKDCIKAEIDDLPRIGLLSYPWMCLVCCTGYSSPDAGLPDRAYGMAQALTQGEADLPFRVRKKKAQRVPEPIEGATNLPAYVQTALEPGTDIQEDFQEILLKRAIDGLLILREEE